MEKTQLYSQLSRRERQIMDVVFAAGEVTARQVHQGIPEPPSYSAVRALLARLVDKEVLSFRRQGRQYLYAPVADPATAGRSALRHLLDTFFQGSAVKAANALLGQHSESLSASELKELGALIDHMQREKDAKG